MWIVYCSLWTSLQLRQKNTCLFGGLANGGNEAFSFVGLEDSTAIYHVSCKITAGKRNKMQY